MADQCAVREAASTNAPSAARAAAVVQAKGALAPTCAPVAGRGIHITASGHSHRTAERRGTARSVQGAS